MFYEGLRIFGFFLHDDNGYRGALQAIKQEMSERGEGYQPSREFKKSMDQLYLDSRALGGQLIAAAESKEVIEGEALLALHRAEHLYALGNAPGPKVAFRNCTGLNDGMGTDGSLSLTRKVQTILGLSAEQMEQWPKHPVPVKASQIFAL